MIYFKRFTSRKFHNTGYNDNDQSDQFDSCKKRLRSSYVLHIDTIQSDDENWNVKQIKML